MQDEVLSRSIAQNVFTDAGSLRMVQLKMVICRECAAVVYAVLR